MPGESVESRKVSDPSLDPSEPDTLDWDVSRIVTGGCREVMGIPSVRG
jgi:hypothetical protein